MRRFDCPNCRNSLRWRLLPHVPQANGQLAFACVHCGAVLGYGESSSPAARFFLGTRLRSVLTYVGGLVLFSAVQAAAGSAVVLGILVVLAACLAAVHLLSSSPAYRVIGTGRSGEPSGVDPSVEA